MLKFLIPELELYSIPRYWYHLSTTLKRKQYTLEPRKNDEGFNRSDDEPDIGRICVSPTVEQCLVAIPYEVYEKFYIYRTTDEIVAHNPKGIFDCKITQEGWILKSTSFVRIGILRLSKIFTPKKRRVKIKEEAASSGDSEVSKKLLKWWIRISPMRFVKMD